MKQHLLSAYLAMAMLLIPSLSWADVEINEANFPDAAFRAVLMELPEGKDGVLTDEEITGLQSLSLTSGHSENIKSLKGIEHLTALRSLEMFGANKLKELDLTQNKTLGVLRLSLAFLNELKLSGLSDLVFLSLHGVFGIKELDLSGCIALETLGCMTTDFEQLNIQDCTELKELWCSECKLTSLDLSWFPHLKHLYCDNNQLTSLDVSVLPELEILNCSYNPLSNLDVSKNTSLRELWGVSNKLNNLDLSANKKLCFLNCALNDISSDSMTDLLTSLPQAAEGGELYLKDTESTQEMNYCNEEQEQIAIGKNWTILRERPVIYGGGGGGHTLDISTAQTQNTKSSDGYFTLDGRRLQGKPISRGLYIHNGRKVLMP